MNERIKELTAQARKYARDYVEECKHSGYYMDHNEYELRFEEKFAELIVWECAEVARLNTRVDSKVYLMIQEHFGVEE